MVNDHDPKAAERQAHLRLLCAQLFAERRRCILEIGCGHGHWLTAYAAAYPECFCVGIDVRSRRIAKARQKQEKQGLTNLAFHKAEAMEWFVCLPVAVQLDAVFVLFPDPWPKRRHHKNRLIQSTFLDILTAKMIPQARLYFRTDHCEYFAWTERVLHDHPRWQISDEPWPFESSTYFEQMTDAAYSLVACVTDSRRA